jgi:6-phosphogluconolactonase (cycloisomerase 2 family)
MRLPIVLVAFVVTFVPGVARAQAPTSFAQLEGAAGCLRQLGAESFEDEEVPETCALASGLGSAYAAVLSPDQRFVYVVASGGRTSGSSAITTFGRDAANGALAFTGCLSATGGDGRVGSDGLCGRADALLGVRGLAITADGRFAYAVAAGASAVSWFDRDPATGALTQRGCLKQAVGPRERCRLGYALGGAAAVALSPDERFVYVASAASGAVAVFARDADTGVLTERGCVSDTGSDGQCLDGVALSGARRLVVPADGRNVYLTSSSGGAVAALARDAETGAVTPVGCLMADPPVGGPCTAVPTLAGATSAAISGDGRTLYVAGEQESTLVALARDTTSGALTPASCLQHVPPEGADAVDDPDYYDEVDHRFAECAPAKALENIDEIAVSRDGRAVYGAGYGLAAFRRDPTSGALTQFGCAQSDLEYRSCSEDRAVGGVSGLAVSDDGRNLYVLSSDSSSVAVYGAALAITSASARMTRAGTIAVRLACPAVRALGCAGVVRAGGASIARFRVPGGATRTVQLRLSARVAGVVRRHGRTSVRVVARDGRLRTVPITGRVAVSSR